MLDKIFGGSQSPLPKSSGKIEVQLSFPHALEALIGGKQIRRKEWADKQEYGLLRDSFLSIHRDGKFHTWLVSEGDMMALDWEIMK